MPTLLCQYFLANSGGSAGARVKVGPRSPLRTLKTGFGGSDNRDVMRRLLPRTALWGALIALPVLLLTPPTGAGAGTYQKAKVIRVIDGDTIDVDANFDGRIDARIRLLGIDAPEHGLCNFQASKAALARLVGHRVIELRSDRGRTGIMNRPERRVIVTVAGKKIDASTWMLERGWGVWMPRQGEHTASLQQHQAADRAAAAGLGWFNPTRCGAGPAQEDPLVMQAEYLSDATYSMTAAQRRNQEFIRIRNDGPTPINIDGWTLRVGNDRKQHVPAGGPIPPGGAIEVHVGFGTNTPTDRYLGSSVPMLVNASIDGGPHLGSGSYLIDPDDDIRAHMTWPCTYQCADPAGGSLVFSHVEYDPPGMEGGALNTEYVAITNEGQAAVRTGDLVLEEFPFIYEFPPNHWIQPGETLRVSSGSGANTLLSRHLGAPVPPLHNDKGRVLLRTYDAIVVDCFAWGTDRCPPGS
jgi:endonuclease YncB( thermonuclease family)